MIYEIRVYTPHDGKAEALRQRFLQHTLRLFDRAGIEVVEVLAPASSPGMSPGPAGDDLWYITRFADEAARTAAWDAFKADPEWPRIKAATETDGPLLKAQTVTVLTALPHVS
jgi:hypothetical protein